MALPLTASHLLASRQLGASRARTAVAHGVEHGVQRRQIDRAGFQARKAIISQVERSPSIRAPEDVGVTAKAHVEQRRAHRAKVQLLFRPNRGPDRVADTAWRQWRCSNHAGRLPDGRANGFANPAMPSALWSAAMNRRFDSCESGDSSPPSKVPPSVEDRLTSGVRIKCQWRV